MLREIYHKSPEPVKNAIKKAHSKIPFPYIYGLKFAKYYKWLMKTQWLPPEELEEIQNERLRIIINHAYENVPYYRRIFDERGLKPKDVQTKEDLKLLPILTKDDIRGNFNELQAKNVEKYNPEPIFTGGSTGEPLKVYLSKDTRLMVEACVRRHWNWIGFNYNDKMAMLRAPEDYSSTYKSQILKTQKQSPVHPNIYYDKAANTLYLSPYDMCKENLSEYAKALLKFKPKMLRGTPSSLYIFAKFLKQKSIIINLHAVQVSSETLYAFQRELIEEQFNCSIYSWYGSGEKVIKAGECSIHNGYHINSEFGIIELMRKDVHMGDIGEIIATTLVNYAMPLIRYQIGDLGALSKSQCPCGRGLPLLKSIEGKIRDIVITPDGKIIHGEFFKYIIEKPWIKIAKCHQTEIDQIEIDIVPISIPPKEEITKIENKLQNHLGDNMKININFVDDIAPTKVGKRHYIISDVSQQLFRNDSKG